MRVYEVLFIVAPNIEESDIDTLVTQLSDVATNQGARAPRSIDGPPQTRISIGNSTTVTTWCSLREPALRSPNSNGECSDRRGNPLHNNSHRRDLKRAEFRVRRAAMPPPAPALDGAVVALNLSFPLETMMKTGTRRGHNYEQRTQGTRPSR
jgi:hypothetical protein